MSVVVECPSGMQLRIRGLKGKESKLLSDANGWRSGSVVDQLLVACTEEVVEPGPYASAQKGKVDWGKVVVGDRFFTFMQIRIASFGPEYIFRTQCRDGGCRERFEHEIDLSKDLVVKYMTDEDREILMADGLYTTSTSDGRAVKYRLLTGDDERMMAKNRSSQKTMVDSLARRIVSIEGVGEVTESDIVNQRSVKQVRQHLDDMEFGELVKLLDALDEHDCGVDPKIEIECPHCGGVQQQILPLELTFFRPTANTISARTG